MDCLTDFILNLRYPMRDLIEALHARDGIGSLKKLALKVGVGVEALYAYTSKPMDEGGNQVPLSLKKIIQITRESQLFHLIEAVCHECGGWFIPFIKIEAGRIQSLQGLLKELVHTMTDFTSFIDSINKALRNRDISHSELEVIKEKADHLIRQLLRLVQFCVNYSKHPEAK